MLSDKRKISGKENIKKAQAALKEKREKEKNNPLVFDSDDDDDEPILTFKNKDKKKYKELEAKMDLLIENQRQLCDNFQKRKERKKKSATPAIIPPINDGREKEKKSDNPCKSTSILF